MIRIKKLPYIPAIPPVSSGIHHLFVRDIMVSDVKFITLETTYGELQDMLAENPKISAFPLVDQKSSVILLGSISRPQLFEAIEEQVGERARKFEAQLRRRKVNPAANYEELRKALSPDYLKTEDQTKENGKVGMDQTEPTERKVSRFSVRRVSSMEALSSAISASLDKESKKERAKHLSSRETAPQQSAEISQSTYNKFRSTVHAVSSYMNSLPFKFRQSLRRTANQPLLAQLDLTQSERLEWENVRLSEYLNFDTIQIDPAPFQLVETTSLLRVHALFWLLGLHRSYVTSLGRLVGVVSLRELRLALEKTTQFLSPLNRKRTIEELDGACRSPLLPVVRDPSALSRLNSVNPSDFVPNQAAILRIANRPLSGPKKQ